MNHSRILYRQQVRQIMIRMLSRILLVGFVLFSSCSQEPVPGEPAPEPVPEPAPDIFIAGFYHSNYWHLDMACAWKNSVLLDVDLMNVNSQANSIAVSNDIVYLGGVEFLTAYKDTRGTAWTDGMQNFVDQKESEVKSVFFFDASLYMGGWSLNEQGKRVATVWKDGTPQTLADVESSIESIFVTEDGVYAAGNRAGDAVYWKNGLLRELEIEDGGWGHFATSIFVVNDDVYVAGLSNGRAVFWKNDEKTQLNWAGAVTSIFVDGTDVYVTGWSNLPLTKESFVKLWKNGVEKDLTDGTSEAKAFAMYVYKGQPYVVGVHHGQATVWYDGQEFTLSIDQSEARSIVIVPPATGHVEY